MNYKRIYNEFIKDRLSKQPTKPDYFELHHIVPKSLCGTNEKSNIIKLSASDHYFAHLCLAKIHGGKQWLSVICMTKMLISKKRKDEISIFSKRKMVSVAREKSAKYRSELLKGKKTRSKKPVYTIFNIDGRVEKGSMIELKEKTGVSLPSIYRLVKKLQGCTYCGWYFEKNLMLKTKEKKQLNIKNIKNTFSGKNKKQVKCNETGIIYESINDAKNKTGIIVGNYLNKKRKHAGGFTWTYV